MRRVEARFTWSLDDCEWAPVDCRSAPDDGGRDVSGEVGEKGVWIDGVQRLVLHLDSIRSADSTWVTFECLMILWKAVPNQGVRITSRRDGHVLSQMIIPPEQLSPSRWLRVSTSFNTEGLSTSRLDNFYVHVQFYAAAFQYLIVDNVLLWEKPGSCPWGCDDQH
eukprot:2895565-Rhodomonas_salina.1